MHERKKHATLNNTLNGILESISEVIAYDIQRLELHTLELQQ